MFLTEMQSTISSVIFFIFGSIVTGTGGAMLLRSAKKIDKIQRSAATSGEKKGQELLDRSGGVDRLDNIVIGSFTDYKKMAEIDSIIHGKYCLVTLEIKSWSGKIYANKEEKEWKIITNRGETITRRNPLLQAERHASIVREFYPEVRVVPLTLILGWNEFIGDIPDGVITYKTAWKFGKILNHKEENDDEVNVNKVWDQIVSDEYNELSENRAKTYLSKIKKIHRDPRPWLNALIASACFIFLAMAVIYNFLKSGNF